VREPLAGHFPVLSKRRRSAQALLTCPRLHRVTELPLENVRIVLNGGAYTAIPHQDGSFKLHSVRDTPARRPLPASESLRSYLLQRDKL
jgi:hypothetical protein